METRNRLRCSAVTLVLLMALLPGCAHRTVQFRFPDQNVPGITVIDRGKTAVIDPALRIAIDRGQMTITSFSYPFYKGNLSVRIFNSGTEPVVLPKASVILRCFYSDVNEGDAFYAEPVLEREVVVEPQQEVRLRFERIRVILAHFRLTATYRLQGREHQAEVPMEVYD